MYIYDPCCVLMVLFVDNIHLHIIKIETNFISIETRPALYIEKGNFDRGEDRHIGLFHTCIVLLQTDLRSAN